MTCGIYLLTNKINGKVYVGQSTDIEGRWLCHQTGRARGQPKLDRAFLKYGSGAFTYDILEVCEADVDVLNKLEVKWGVLLRAIEDGYNCKLGGRGCVVVSEETRRRISQGQKGKKLSADHIEKIRKMNKGRVHTAETRAKVSAAGMGRRCTAETREKRSRSLKGRKFSEEHRRKLSERMKGSERAIALGNLNKARRGVPLSEEHRRAVASSGVWDGRPWTDEMRAKLSGRVKSAEERKKLSEAHKGKPKSEEHRRRLSAINTDHARDARIKADLAMGQPTKHIAEAEGVHESSIYQILDRFKRDGVMVPHMLAASQRTIEMFT